MPATNFRLIAAPPAPFHGDGRLNLEVVDSLAQWLKRSSVDGVFVNGTTGECTSLTSDERMELVDCWSGICGPNEMELIVQVGGNCQADAILLAQHAQKAGADAIAAFAPSYFRPDHVDDLIAFLRPVAAASGDLPFYFYDIPSTTQVRLPVADFLVRAKSRIPNLAGLKYSNPDLVQLQECLQIDDGYYQVLFGCDDILLAAAVLGITGAVGGTYNFSAPLYRRMLSAFSAGDLAEARACQLRSVAFIRRMSREGFIPACKAALEMLKIDCGPVRAPLRTLTLEQRRSLWHDLEELGIGEVSPPTANPVPIASSAK